MQVHQSSSTQLLPPISVLPREADLPLSFAQQRLWLLDQLDPRRASYIIPYAVSIKGPLNIAALEQSLKEVLRRHEALRTRFPALDGRPYQLIDQHPTLDLHIIDLSRLSEADRSVESQSLARREAQRPFDLSSDLLIRARL